ncbi:rhomboid-domain-containing protein [Trametes coccinea BRFM310]|uniref:Rhomboid-domain-containing protein n=1 Tax=Trametes coccinea (strain BRFM310) TaxID=1353009 RepID=A0A1Y2IDE2_TRAC3|nr:rhomboid-domain-containing protein [Trametes coccinea BRFM310]
MKRALLSLSPLLSSANAFRGSAFTLGLRPRICLSTRNLSLGSLPLARAPGVLQTPPRAFREQSVWQFIASRLSKATHRSGIARGSSRGSGGYGGGPEGPWQRFRARINAIPSPYIFWGIVGLNGLVFAFWKLAWIKYQSTGDGSSYVWMMQNFIASSANLKAGRWWTLVTCCFSHEDVMHILFNGMTYYFMAPAVLSILGNVGFLGLYLGSGIASSLAGIAWRDYTQRGQASGAHGASGAIYSVVSFFACVAPTTTFLLFGIVPVPAWAFVTGIFLYDGYSAVNQTRAGTDTAGHIGGLLSGVAFYIAKRLRLF